MEGALVVARLWAFLVHFIATALLLSNRIQVVQAAISVNSEDPDADYQAGYDRLMGLIPLAVIGFALQLFCMFIHFQTAARAVVLFHLVADVLGAAVVFWMILDTWSWWMYICVFVLFVLPPSLLDFGLLVRPIVRRWHRQRAKAGSRRR